MGEELAGAMRGRRQPVYVEIAIRASMDRVWMLSQDPELHPRWDLRFSRIIPLAGGDAQDPVHFRYEFRLPLHTIRGTGTSLGHRYRNDGQATSVLRFDTSDRLSPIGAGSGYWRYIPAEEGLRFVTGYNYRPGMGLVGQALDAALIRPALGWATALSFDRLRLWAESDVDPRNSRNRWILDATSRAAAALAAGGILVHALAGNGSGRTFLLGAALLASSFLPPHWTVPRAARCRRQPSNDSPARAPSALDALPVPRAKQPA
ncbi:SRPBCC family protein [Arthrobacter sp. C152]